MLIIYKIFEGKSFTIIIIISQFFDVNGFYLTTPGVNSLIPLICSLKNITTTYMSWNKTGEGSNLSE